MVEYGREDAAGAAGRGSNYLPAGSILFCHGEGIGEDEGACTDVISVAGGFDEVGVGFAAEVQRSREHSLRVYPSFHGFDHGLPHEAQVVPYIRPLTFLHILPIAFAGSLAVA